MSDLKPCPCCKDGGAPRLSNANDKVICNACGLCALDEYSWNTRSAESKIKAAAFCEVGEILKHEYEGAYNRSDIESFFDDLAEKLEKGE